MSDQTPMNEAPPAPPSAPGAVGATNDNGKLLAALGYPITLVAVIMLFVEPYKNDAFVRIHALQAIALAVAWFVLSSVLSMVLSAMGPLAFLSVLLGPAYLILMLFFAWKAYQGEEVEIPVITDFVKKQFA